MSYRSAGDIPPGVEIGPLTPYQRPYLVTLYLMLVFFASGLIGWLILESGWLRSWVREQAVTPMEVKHDTIDVAKFGHDLLLDVRSRLREFDNRSRRIFGHNHTWVVDGARAPIPDYIFKHVKDSRNSTFLRDYSRLSLDRFNFELGLGALESRIDHAVSTIPSNATADRVFGAERLVHHSIEDAIEHLEICFSQLDQLEQQYSKD